MAAILSYPNHSTNNFPSGFSSTAIFRRGFVSFQSPEMASGSGGIVHVAVGKSVDKTVALLRWVFETFPGQEVRLLHVHRPSPRIPTLLGRLPASQANPEVVASFRNEEREETTNLLLNYMMICSRYKVKATIIASEADKVQNEIVDLVNRHTITKLVIGAIPDCAEGKKISCKASHAAKHAPSYCELWFVNKGKLVWTREASESASFVLPRSRLFPSSACNSRSRSFESDKHEMGASETVKSTERSLCIQLAGLKVDVEESKNEVYLKLLEDKKLGGEAVEQFNKVKVMEMAHSREVQLRTDAEDALKITMHEKENLLEEKEKISHQLQKTMRNIALLETRAQESNRRREEVAGDLKIVQASLSSLRQEKHKLEWQKIEATIWLDRWRNHDRHDREGNENRFIVSGGGFSELSVFLLSDLESATCDFSESFRIGHGGYGVVYKGELFSKTVAVKKLHLHDLQRQTHFHKEVQVLGKLHHPNLVELIGVCPESWLLVYEYLPGGSLQNYLFNKNNISALNWIIRAQMVADIASALLFLHSSTPKKIVHGNLKPGNILLDHKLKCKISDYGDHMLTSSKILRYPSFRHCTAQTGAFSYRDPESHRTGALTPKSDIYSFGLIILQLVTGKTEGALVGEVRRAVSNGKATSVLDISAGDWSTYVGRRLVELGLQCCESNSRDRPEFTQSLVKELERLPFLEEQTVPSFFLCPILRELMHDPQVAADGFTYEGEALHGWLENGHETSPMTNLKLSHLNLTPNLALKLAIQDWICKS